MEALGIIKYLYPTFTENNAKIHLASFNGIDNPIDVYLAGGFPEWQEKQKSRNFERPYVLSLIQLSESNQWLFAGLWKSEGIIKEANGTYRYQLKEVAECAELKGRLIVEFRRPGRNAYLLAEKWVNNMLVKEIRRNPLSIRDFPGYRNVNISFPELKIIVKESYSSWMSALSSVAGIYLITDTTSGKLYVGSASGLGGFWNRWEQYATSSHGGNKMLREVVQNDPEHSNNWRISILEISDVTTSEESILVRESHWKTILLTRDHGFNAN